MYNEELTLRIRAIFHSQKYAIATHIRDGKIFVISMKDKDLTKEVHTPSTDPDKFIPITNMAIPSLLFLLNDIDRYVRRGSIHALSTVKRLIEKNLAHLRKKQNGNQLMVELNQFNTEILDALITIRDTDTDLSIRAYTSFILDQGSTKDENKTIDNALEALKGEKDSKWRFDLNVNLLNIMGFDSIAYDNLLKMLEENQLAEHQETIVKRFTELKELIKEKQGISSHHSKFEIISKDYDEKKKKLEQDLIKKGIIFQFKI